MILKRFTVGTLYTNCYVVGCAEAKEALIVDPGFERDAEAERVLGEIDRQALRVRYIVNTHGHFDHTSGNGAIKEATGALILVHELDTIMLTPRPADRTLREGDVLRVGEVMLKVLHTPGHSRGSISLLGEGVVFTGDTLWAGTIGRTDLPGGSYEDMVRSLKAKLATLPDHVEVYPGHGPASTIGEEKKHNPFLQNLQ